MLKRKAGFCPAFWFNFSTSRGRGGRFVLYNKNGDLGISKS
jgi:hypothetical protein